METYKNISSFHLDAHPQSFGVELITPVKNDIFKQYLCVVFQISRFMSHNFLYSLCFKNQKESSFLYKNTNKNFKNSSFFAT